MMKKIVVAGFAMALAANTVAFSGGMGRRPADRSPISTVPPFTSITMIQPGAPINPFNANGLPKIGMDLLPLAFFKQTTNPDNPAAYWPALAQRWKLNHAGSVLTVWLRQAKWSNGTSITAQDVKTSWAIRFVMGLAQGYYLSQVKVLGPREIQFVEVPGTHYNMFLDSMLSQIIVPAAEYGHLLPKHIWTVIKESEYTGHNPAAQKTAAKAQTELTQLDKTVTTFAPATDIASGPFVLTGVNPGEVVFKKNPHFYGQATIHVSEVVLRNNTGGPSDWSYMIDGINQATGGIPLNVLEQAKKTPGNVFYRVHVYGLAGIAFGEHHYPYNLLPVREAFAYLLNRKSIQHVANPVSGTPAHYLDGMIDSETNKVLTVRQRSALQPYAYNPAKAAAILRKAGFRKTKRGQWLMPNGKPWTLTLYAPAGYPAWVSAVEIIARELTGFGIRAKFATPELATYFADQVAGTYPVSMAFGQEGPEAYYTWSPYYGTADGYKTVGSQLVRVNPGTPNGENWIDFPTTVNVKGVGKVSPGVLTNALERTSNSQTIKATMVKLALLTNQYVPFIPLWDNLQTGFINQRQYTKFPLKNSQVMEGAAGYFPPVGLWMMLGYIRPR